MGLITKVAFFSLCQNCGGHGHIVQPDGTQGVEFVSKQEGHAEVRDLYLRKIIEPDEATFLKEEIDKSTLPEKEPPGATLVRAIVQQELARMSDDEFDNVPMDSHSIH